MLIGIVGMGVVGQASAFGFQKLGNDVVVHDIKMDTKINDVISSEVIFISVPTPQSADGNCDTSIVESVIDELVNLNYKGVIAIRSTVKPGTTEKLVTKYERICFVPEFLRERCAVSDFVENNKILAVGTHDKKVYDLIRDCFGHYPKFHIMLTPTEAELLKYMHNTMSALRVIFANEFYEICQKLSVNYTKIKNSLLHSTNLPDIYLDVNESMRGYGGTCLRKDIPAMNALVKELGIDVNLFDFLEKENSKFKTTVFPGMRL